MSGLRSDIAAASAIGSLDPQVTEVRHAAGILYTVEWLAPNGELAGTMRLDARPPEAWFLDLSMEPAWQRRGVYAGLCMRLRDALREHGVANVRARPGSPLSESILRRGGLVDVGGGILGADLSDEQNRVDQYAAHKATGSSEPAWHRRLEVAR